MVLAVFLKCDLKICNETKKLPISPPGCYVDAVDESVTKQRRRESGGRRVWERHARRVPAIDVAAAARRGARGVSCRGTVDTRGPTPTLSESLEREMMTERRQFFYFYVST